MKSRKRNLLITLILMCISSVGYVNAQRCGYVNLSNKEVAAGEVLTFNFAIENSSLSEPVMINASANCSSLNSQMSVTEVSTEGNLKTMTFQLTTLATDGGKTCTIQVSTTPLIGNSCVGSFEVSIDLPPCNVEFECATQSVAPAFPHEASALLTPTINNVQAPVTYNWSNGETTESIIVSPTATTTYTLSVTDGAGCNKSASTTVETVDVKCPDDPEEIALCKLKSKGEKEDKCEDMEKALEKLAEPEYSLGPCSFTGSFESSCGEPVYFSCDCIDRITSAVFEYTGPAGATVIISEDKIDKKVISTNHNVATGALIGINDAQFEKKEVKDDVKIFINNDDEIKFELKCDEVSPGLTVGKIKLINYTDITGAVCDDQNLCRCDKKVVKLSLKYKGTNTISVNVYEKDDKKTVLAYGTLSTDGVIIVNDALIKNKLKDEVYLEIVGSETLYPIPSECGSICPGVLFNDFQIVGFVDDKGAACNF